MKNNLKKKKQKHKQNYHNLPRDCAGPASIILMLTQLSQRYKYDMLTNSAYSIAITFFLLVNFWKVEGYHHQKYACFYLFALLGSVVFFSPVETIMIDRKTLN